ncbi:hypothetical protein BCA37_20785 [Mycobacterium sp. djl-10]|nr:hypothetical protein BCA37_20785 [Mycobacterium sp. djl-10]
MDEFMKMRPQLFGIAYRMLGCAGEAEDALQDVWIRWQGCDRDAIREPSAFLVTTTTRVCLNVLQSARVRREMTLGAAWFPEPVDIDADPSADVQRRDDVHHATQVLLETLPPAERAAFILREAFDYPYAAIARILGVTDINARQLAHRARKHLAAGHRRGTAGAAEHQQLLAAFVAAAHHGHTSGLEDLLAASA